MILGVTKRLRRVDPCATSFIRVSEQLSTRQNRSEEPGRGQTWEPVRRARGTGESQNTERR